MRVNASVCCWRAAQDDGSDHVVADAQGRWSCADVGDWTGKGFVAFIFGVGIEELAHVRFEFSIAATSFA
jgi:hypothetical protein